MKPTKPDTFWFFQPQKNGKPFGELQCGKIVNCYGKLYFHGQNVHAWVDNMEGEWARITYDKLGDD